MTVPSSDGKHKLFGRVFLPVDLSKAKGIFQTVHGMTEHSGRYTGFLTEMANNGYIAFAFDNLGHGHTAADQSQLGFIAHKDGWKYLVNDVAIFYDAVRGKYDREGKLPYYLLGHSMGSFIVRCAALNTCFPDKLIVMGTGGPNPASGFGIAAANVICALKGDRYVSGALDRLIFGNFNRNFRSENDNRSWLSTNGSNREKYKEDGLCGFKFSASALRDLITLNDEANSRKWFLGMKDRMPVLLLSGSDDPVGGCGKAVTVVCERLNAAGARAEIKLYKGARHEILNDFCHDAVVRDILDFIS